MLDQNNTLFTVTDLKQFMYCPRILFYHACLPDVRPTTYKMQAGIAAHFAEPKRSQRREYATVEDLPPNSERLFGVHVMSAEIGLSGELDEVIVAGDQFIPVDYKYSKRTGDHFKLQLAAYALLLEETFETKVTMGLLYLIPLRKTIRVPITSQLRGKVLAATQQMQSIAVAEHFPQPTEWRQRCPDCEFRRFCHDVV